MYKVNNLVKRGAPPRKAVTCRSTTTLPCACAESCLLETVFLPRGWTDPLHRVNCRRNIPRCILFYSESFCFCKYEKSDSVNVLLFSSFPLLFNLSKFKIHLIYFHTMKSMYSISKRCILQPQCEITSVQQHCATCNLPVDPDYSTFVDCLNWMDAV